jgi:hypothetical protein
MQWLRDEDAQQIVISHSTRDAQPLPPSLSSLAHSQGTYETVSTASQKPTTLL